jgi:hypothetical protein
VAKGFLIAAMMAFIAGVQTLAADPSLHSSGQTSATAAVPEVAASSESESAHSPSPFAAHYSALWNKKGWGSEASYRLSRLDQHRYLLQLTLSAPFIRAEEQVEFAWREKRPQPLRYKKVRRTLGRERIEEAHFNWDTNTVHWRKGDDQGTLPLVPNTLDKLSLQLVLACHLPEENRGRLHFSVFDGNHIKTYVFQRLEEETLSLPIGTVDTVKIKRLREEGNKRRETFLWLAPNYHYMVVRMRQIEGSNSAEIKLKEIELAPNHRLSCQGHA